MNKSRISFKTAKLLSFIIFLSLIVACGGGGSGSDTALSSAKQITALSFTSPAATGNIDQSARTILVRVPSGTDVTALVASFATTGQSVVVGSTNQTSGVTSNNYTNPVTYRVNAADGSYQDYTVTVIIVLIAQWAQTLTAGTETSGFRSVAVASDGSVYAAGSINGTGTYNFGNGVTVTGAANYVNNTVLVKYNSAGIAQWAQTMTTVFFASASWFNSVTVASDGSVYAAGVIDGTGTYNFGNGVTVTGTSNADNPVLVKYNSAGIAQWAQTVTVGLLSGFNSVTVASDGSVYASGYIHGTGTYNFGNGVTATGSSTVNNTVLVKYNSGGIAQWAQTVTTGFSSGFNSVTVASDGAVYAAGHIDGSGTYNFGNSVTATGATPDANLVLVKYNSAGTAQWAQTITAGTSNSEFNSVKVASDSSVYAVGVIDGTGTYNFGNSVTAAGTFTGHSNLVLVKYNSAGTAQWAQTVTAGTSNSVFNSVTVASDGSVYAAGVIDGTGTYNFGNSVTATGAAAGVITQHNLVLVKYSSIGIAQWAQTLSTGNSDSGFNSVTVASDSSVYAAGYINGTGAYNFGNSVTITGADPSDNTVLVKYK